MEPGCYFIDALLTPAIEISTISKFFNKEAIGRFRGFGGVRIESDVVRCFRTSKSQIVLPHMISIYLLCGLMYRLNQST